MRRAAFAEDAATFRQAMQSLAGAVTVVTGRDSDGQALGMTATAVMSLSAEPPSVIVSLNRDTRLARSLTLGARIGVNVLADGQHEVAGTFGGFRRELSPAERFAQASWTESDEGLLLLDDALLQMECVVDTAVARATHLVYFCVVARARIAESQPAPLLYFRREFTTLGA